MASPTSPQPQVAVLESEDENAVYDEYKVEYPRPETHDSFTPIPNYGPNWVIKKDDVIMWYYEKKADGQFWLNLGIPRTSPARLLSEMYDEINQRYPTNIYRKIIRFYRGKTPLNPRKLQGDKHWDQITDVRVFASRREDQNGGGQL